MADDSALGARTSCPPVESELRSRKPARSAGVLTRCGWERRGRGKFLDGADRRNPLRVRTPALREKDRCGVRVETPFPQADKMSAPR